MKKKLRLGKNIDKDVVLCRTTNRRVSNRTTDLLVEDAIPFTKNWKHIPFFRREQYHGASEICVISINRNTYARARRCLDRMERRDRARLNLNLTAKQEPPHSRRQKLRRR